MAGVLPEPIQRSLLCNPIRKRRQWLRAPGSAISWDIDYIIQQKLSSGEHEFDQSCEALGIGTG